MSSKNDFFEDSNSISFLVFSGLKLDGVKLSLGRLQNLMNSACVEHLDFSNNINWADLDVEPFVQLQHKPTLTHIEMAKQLPKTESIQNFQVSTNVRFCSSL